MKIKYISMCMAAIAAMSLLACHGAHDDHDHDHDHDADEHETTKADAMTSTAPTIFILPMHKPRHAT